MHKRNVSAMKTMAYWVGLILVGLSYGEPPTGLVITIVITFIVIVFAIRASKMARPLAEGTEMDITNAFCDRR